MAPLPVKWTVVDKWRTMRQELRMVKKQAEDTRLSVRVSGELARRVSALQPKLAKDPNVKALSQGGRATASTVIKLALSRGLDALEREYK